MAIFNKMIKGIGFFGDTIRIELYAVDLLRYIGKLSAPMKNRILFTYRR